MPFSTKCRGHLGRKKPVAKIRWHQRTNHKFTMRCLQEHVGKSWDVHQRGELLVRLLGGWDGTRSIGSREDPHSGLVSGSAVALFDFLLEQNTMMK